MRKTSLALIGLLTVLLSSPAFLEIALCSWSSTTPLPMALYAPGSVSHGDKIYVVGGEALDDTSRAEVCYATVKPDGHVDSNGWTSTMGLPEGRVYPGVAVYNDWVYVLGGCYDGGWMERNTVWFAHFNPDGTISNWVGTTAMPYPSHKVAVVQWNGRLYILAGWDGFSQHNDVYFAVIQGDGTIGSWTSTTSLPEARAHGYTAVVHDGVIYFIGGTTPEGPAVLHRNVYFALIQPNGEVGAWVETTALPVGLEANTAGVYEDYIYVIGGAAQSAYPEWIMTDKVLRAHVNPDHTLDAWEECCALPAPLCHHASTLQQGRIYVIGGQHEGEDASDVVQFLQTSLPSAPVGGEWVPITTLQMLVQIIGSIAAISALAASFVGLKRTKKRQN